MTTGTDSIIEQIKSQLEKLVPVHRVVDLTLTGDAVERELCLVKVVGKGDHRVEAMRLAAAFGARTMDATLNSFVYELTGTTEEIERFIKLMTAVGLVGGLPHRGRGHGPRRRGNVSVQPLKSLCCQKGVSSGVDSRPRMALRWGKRPKRATMSW